MKPVLSLCAQPLFEARGSPIRVKAFLRALGNDGISVDVITLPVGPNVRLPRCIRLSRVLNLLLVKSVAIGPSVPKLIFGVLIALRGLLFAMTRRYSSVHGIEEMGLPAWILARLSGARFVFEKHSDPDSHRSDSRVRNFVMSCYAAMERFVCRRADIVIATGSGLAAQVASYGTDAEIYVVSDVPTSDREACVDRIPHWRSRFGCQPGETVAAYIGSFAGYQAVPLFLEAVRVALPKNPLLRVVLVGGSKEDGEKVRTVGEESGCPERLVHFERIDQEEVPDFLQSCEILVSPRMKGGNTPLKVLDYLRSGQCILAVDTDANRLVVDEEVSLMVPPTVEGLADGMERLMNDQPLRERLGKAGRQRFESRFGFDRFRDELIKVFGRSSRDSRKKNDN